jgi:hypothetical protein
MSRFALGIELDGAGYHPAAWRCSTRIYPGGRNLRADARHCSPPSRQRDYRRRQREKSSWPDGTTVVFRCVIIVSAGTGVGLVLSSPVAGGQGVGEDAGRVQDYRQERADVGDCDNPYRRHSIIGMHSPVTFDGMYTPPDPVD